MSAKNGDTPKEMRVRNCWHIHEYQIIYWAALAPTLVYLKVNEVDSPHIRLHESKQTNTRVYTVRLKAVRGV